MSLVQLIATVRSGVAQVLIERDRQWIGFGSAFLVTGGLVTCSHNIRSRKFDAIALRFEEADPAAPESYIRFDPARSIAAESPEGDKDYVFLRMREPEFNGRYVFEFIESSALTVGDQVLFLGYPFGMPQLTSHIGYVSSIHMGKSAELIQIDGSVNGGNSGGPLIDLKTGSVAGLITRSVTGFVEEQFDQLIQALRDNQEALAQVQGAMAVRAGKVTVDPMRALRASQAAMQRIAQDLKRSANVGIGYAYSADHLRAHIDTVIRQFEQPGT